MLKKLSDLLPKDKFDCWALDYPASYGVIPFPLSLSFDKSVRVGVDALVARIRATSRLVILVGFSQGSSVISVLLEEIAAGLHQDLEIAGVMLIANPMRAPGHSVDPACEGWGVSGEHGPWPEGIPVWEIAHPNDMICCLSGGSIIRTFGDLSSSFSIVDPVAWAVNVGTKISQRSLQAWWNIPERGRVKQASIDFARYPFWHLIYASNSQPFPGTDKSYIHKAAGILIWKFGRE
nr:PE-PPE domain-containing protein [Rhodococcus sp. (in: high G+C Gram-positive bacteria)]